jgi:hypothetical protein
VRFLAALPPDQLQAALKHDLHVSALSEANLELGHLANVGRDSTLGVDYIPSGKYYWAPIFEMGKEEVHSELIMGDTEDEVETEVERRYPGRPKDEVALSDGVFALIVHSKNHDECRGDFVFGVGHRGPFGN